MIKLNASNVSTSYLCFTDKGDLLFLENGFIKISGLHHKHVKHLSKEQDFCITSLAQHKDSVYVASYQYGYISCSIYSYCLSKSQKLCQFACQNTSALAVTEDYLLITDRSSYTQSLHMYTHEGKHVKDISLPYRPDGILPQPGNEIVIREQSYLAKYSITGGSATQRWRVEYRGGSYMTTDSAGVIYSTTSDGYRATLTIYHPENGKQILLLMMLCNKYRTHLQPK